MNRQKEFSSIFCFFSNRRLSWLPYTPRVFKGHSSCIPQTLVPHVTSFSCTTDWTTSTSTVIRCLDAVSTCNKEMSSLSQVFCSCSDPFMFFNVLLSLSFTFCVNTTSSNQFPSPDEGRLGSQADTLFLKTAPSVQRFNQDNHWFVSVVRT